MGSIWLLVGILFASAGDVDILPACCVAKSGQPDVEDPPQIFVRAETRRPHERALEEGAEAPIPLPVPVLIARPVSTEEPVPEPDIDIETAPCCLSAPSDVEDPPPVFVRADTRRPDERVLEEGAEAPEPANAPFVMASLVAAEEPAAAADDHGAPCCEPETGDVEDPPQFLVAAKVQQLADSDRESKAEEPALPRMPILTRAPAPVESRPEAVPVEFGQVEPREAPTVADASRRAMDPTIPLLALFMAFAIWVSRRRRRNQEMAPPPTTRPLPDELSITRLMAAPIWYLDDPARGLDVRRELEPA